jgi:hypothetical protein
MKDFSNEESERLIDQPLKKLKITIESKAKKKLISQISGHPQLLQQTCHFLVNLAMEKQTTISEEDVDSAINSLFIENTTINTLKTDLKNKKLERLIRDIFKGMKKEYHPYKDFSIKGAGPIVADENSFCTIRNEVYKKFFRDTLNIADDESRFQNFEEIETGGMGIVYRAKDTLLDRTVAIKKLSSELTSNKENLERFMKEARTTARLRHKNIIRVYDIKQIKNDHLIIMEFIEGLNYNTIINERNPLPLQEILQVGKNLFTALAYSHKKGVIHRDVKPHNIMRDRDNEIKVLDFGIAVIGSSVEKKESQYIFGAPHYISPEQIKGAEVDQRTDIYSAGVTLFHLATGQVPFDGKNIEEVCLKHLREQPPSIKELRPDIPDELVQIIEKCMKKEKEARYQNAKQVLAKIKTLAATLRKKSETVKFNSVTVRLPANTVKENGTLRKKGNNKAKGLNKPLED